MQLSYTEQLNTTILYTALNSPSLIFALHRSKIDSPSLKFALSSIVLYNSLCIIQFALL